MLAFGDRRTTDGIEVHWDLTSTKLANRCAAAECIICIHMQKNIQFQGRLAEAWFCLSRYMFSYTQGGVQHRLLCIHFEDTESILEFTSKNCWGGHRTAAPSIAEQRIHMRTRHIARNQKKIWVECGIPLHNAAPLPPCAVRVLLRFHTIPAIVQVRLPAASFLQRPPSCAQDCYIRPSPHAAPIPHLHVRNAMS